jgi:SAM-dependent methyltransferase
MPTWDELFAREEYHWMEPHRSVIDLLPRLRNENRARVLDLGSGTGRHTVHLSREGFLTVGVDPAPRGLRRAARWLRSESLPVRVLRGQMSYLPLKDNSFDCVVSVYVMHHATLSRIRRAFAEVERVLVPGGILLTLIQSAGDWKEGLGMRMEANTFLPDSGDEEGIPHHFFSETEIRELLNEFEILQMKQEKLDDRLPGKAPVRHRHWEVLARLSQRRGQHS